MPLRGPLDGPLSGAVPALVNADFSAGSLPIGATFTRASAATYQDAGGVWREAVTNEPRFVADGLLIEPAANNGLRNPRCEGAAVGGALPTNWAVATPGGMTTAVHSIQTTGGVQTVTFRVSGTASGNVYLLAMDTTTGIVTTPGAPFVLSAFAATTGAGQPVAHRLRAQARTSAGSAIAGGIVNAAVTLSATLARVQIAGTMSADGTTARLYPMYEALLTNGAAYDFFVTLGWPNETATATTPILPPVGTPGASSRAAEVCSVALPSVPSLDVEWWGVASGPAGAEQTLWQIDDGSANNLVRVVVPSAGGEMIARRVTGGAGLDSASLGAQVPGEAIAVASALSGGVFRTVARGQTLRSLSGAPTSGLTTLRIGGQISGASSVSGVVSSVRVRARAVTDAMLQAIAQNIGDPWDGVPIEMIVLYGQSRADNRAEGTNVCFAWATTARNPEMALMMNAPSEPGLPFERPYEARWSTRFEPLVDCGPQQGFICDVGGVDTLVQFLQLGQSAGPMTYRFAARDANGEGPQRRWLFLAAGVGGLSIAQLSKGASPFVGTHGTFVPYARMIAAVTQANTLATTVYGVPLVVRAVLWAQGERDGVLGTAPATYKAAMATLAADVTADIQTITGQVAAPLFATDLVPPPGDGSGNTTPISMAQAEGVLEDVTGRVYGIGPVYQHPFLSPSHMSVAGVVAWSEQWANALYPLMRDGTAPTWLRYGTPSVAGNVITLPTIGAQGDLVLDVTTLPLAPNHGFVLTGTAAVITGVSVSGSVVTITCDASPAGGTLGYADTLAGGNAGGTTGYAGAYGNVRDSSGEASILVPGVTLRRFLQSFRVAL